MKTDRNSVTSEIISILGCVDNDGGDEETDSDHPLVGTDDHTTNMTRSALGLI